MVAARPVALLALLLVCAWSCAAAMLDAGPHGQPLPFPVRPHPLRLSAELFASSERVPVSPDVDGMAPPRTEATALGPGAPQLLADVPFPTGAWWTNLVLDKGNMNVVSMPYIFRVLDERLHMSFPFRVVSPRVIEEGFISQMVVSSEPADDDAESAASVAHHVVDFDAFSATVRFSRGDMEEFRAFLVRGSPYVTMEFSHSRPVLQAMDGLSIMRLKKLTNLVFMDGSDVPFATFSAQLNNGQIWYIYASDAALELSRGDDGRITAVSAFTGVLRVALCLDGKMQPYLLESAAVYAVGGDVSHAVDPADADKAQLDFHWKTRSFSDFHGTKASDERETDKLLMLALPHHMDVIQVAAPESNTAASTKTNRVLDELRYTSIRGLMVGVYGAVWHMQETLPAVEWHFKDDGLFSDDFDGVSDVDKQQRLDMRARVMQEILEQLPKDVEAYPPPMSPDVYNFGKQVSREARLLLLAHKLGQQDVQQKLLDKIETELTVWLEAQNDDHFVYDDSFGGVITNDGLHDQGADYGNGYYNDHHFHYGYLLYALAAVRKLDPDYIEQHAAACAMLIGDIGTPLSTSNTSFFHDLPVRSLFPTARHKDWFVGHSYASGLFPMQVGKSQESSSEGLNGYYALALFSSLDEQVLEAQGDSSYHQYARLLLAMELRSVKMYWHMGDNSRIYEPLFSQNVMVGVVGEMNVVYNTWFGDRAVYIHGINMLPFTPLTPQLLDEQFVAREYALLSRELPDLSPYDIWRSIVVLDHAILDGAAAWDELESSVRTFDTWCSRSNSMYWIATRPSWFTQKSRPALSEPVHGVEDTCFGSPACATAGANGTALMCCTALPGCCPSALGCCPEEEAPQDVPSNACFGEYECGILGLGCCNTIDGCCEPDDTGAVLGCCKDQHPVTANTTTHKTPATVDPSVCFGQPLCAAAGLDCCGAPGGCCSGDGAKLDCCSTPTALSTKDSSSHSAGDDDCLGQPQCAAAGLGCCSSDDGCCKPEPETNATLDCCLEPPSETTRTSPADAEICQGQPQCGAAELSCCKWDGGCCQPDAETGATLECCQDASARTMPVDTGDGHGDGDASGSGSASDDKKTSVTKRIFIGLGGAALLVAIVYAIGLCYRRRGYSAIDGDMRALYCAGMMVGVIGFFVFLIVMA